METKASIVLTDRGIILSEYPGGRKKVIGLMRIQSVTTESTGHWWKKSIFLVLGVDDDQCEKQNVRFEIYDEIDSWTRNLVHAVKTARQNSESLVQEEMQLSAEARKIPKNLSGSARNLLEEGSSHSEA